MQMKTHRQAWPVGGAAGEESSLKDQILQEEYELPMIGTSRVNGQRGSERDVVRKRRRSHAGAMGQHVSGPRRGDECMPHRFPILFFFFFLFIPSRPQRCQGIAQYYKATNLRGKTLAVKISTGTGQIVNQDLSLGLRRRGRPYVQT